MAMYRRRVWVGVLVVMVGTVVGLGIVGWSLHYSGVVLWEDLAGGPSRPTLDQLPPEPHPLLGPVDVVKVQLWAMRDNDDEDSGIALAFRFASPQNQSVTGPLDRFARMLKRQFPVMLRFESFELEPAELRDTQARVPVVLFASDGSPHLFVFMLSIQADGPYRGCWLTEGVTPVPIPDDTGDTEDLGEPV